MLHTFEIVYFDHLSSRYYKLLPPYVMHRAISVLKGTRGDKTRGGRQLSLLNKRVRREGRATCSADDKREKSDFVHLAQEIHSDELRRVYTRIRVFAELLIHLTEQSTRAGAPHCHTPTAARSKEGRRVIIIKVTLAHNHSNSRQPVVRRDVARNEREYPTDTEHGAVTLECANSR